MAIESFTEVGDGRGGGLTVEGKRTSSRVWNVKTDSAYDDDVPILADARCPRLGDSHPGQSTMFCISVKARPKAGMKVWRVVAEYATSTRSGEDPTELSKKLDQKPDVVVWDARKIQMPRFKDVNGKALCSSSGEYFDPPIMVEVSIPTLSVTRYQFGFDPALAQQYRDAANSDAFLGATAGQVIVDRIAATSQYEQGTYYWQVQFNFSFAETWDGEFLDRGFYELAAGELVPILDANGIPVTKPVRLDGEGAALAADAAPEDSVFLEFQLKQRLPFSVFNIG